jgi:hypothetical protein
MKKIRITLRQEAKGPKTVLRMFPDSESLYMWMCEPTSDISQIVDLEEDEFIEVEWMGCEFVRFDGKQVPLQLIRAVRAIEVGTPGEITVHPFFGWVPHTEVGFFDYVTDDAVVTKIDVASSKVDMNSVFETE